MLLRSYCLVSNLYDDIVTVWQNSRRNKDITKVFFSTIWLHYLFLTVPETHTSVFVLQPLEILNVSCTCIFCTCRWYIWVIKYFAMSLHLGNQDCNNFWRQVVTVAFLCSNLKAMGAAAGSRYRNMNPARVHVPLPPSQSR